MNTKKTVIFFMIFFVVVILITNILAHAKKITCLDYSDHPDCDIMTAKMNMVELLENRKDTVIFGDSTAEALHPNKLNKRVFNFQQSGQSPIHAYFYLKYMINQGKIPKNVILKYTYSHYSRFSSSLYWDQMLGFKSKAISSADANEILMVDQRMPRPDIGLFENTKNDFHVDQYEEGDPNQNVHRPYYYDLAFGPLMKIKINFNRYYQNFIEFYIFQNNLFKLRGAVEQDESPKIDSKPVCSTFTMNGAYAALPSENGVVAYYVKKLLALAEQENINVYMLGVHVAQSCFQFSETHIPDISDIYLKQFKNINFKYADIMIIPDKFMIDEIHTNGQGSNYYTEQVKPLFDEIQ